MRGIGTAYSGFGGAEDLSTPAAPAQALRAWRSGRVGDGRGAGRLAPAAAACRHLLGDMSALVADVRAAGTLDTAAAGRLSMAVEEALDEHGDDFIALVRLKTPDDYVCMHSVAVAALMGALAAPLGWDADRRRCAMHAGLLHDIGKACIAHEILAKPGSLNAAELRQVRLHPEHGAALLQQAGFVDADVIDVVLHHHERPDGAGYPSGRGGPALSLFARMGAVCDVYDAITSHRPYKRAWRPSEALRHMAEWAGAGQFDADVLGALREVLGPYPTGTPVRLRSGRLAVVQRQRPGQALRPWLAPLNASEPQLVDETMEDDEILGEADAVPDGDGIDQAWAGEQADLLLHAAVPPRPCPPAPRTLEAPWP